MTFTQKSVWKIVRDVHQKKLSVKRAFSKLKDLPYESFSFAKIDHHRYFRKGFPEAIYSPGKTLEQLSKIIKSFEKSGQRLILTRLEETVWRKLRESFSQLHYSKDGRLAYFGRRTTSRGSACVGVITAGTGDIPVAEEAALTLELMGRRVIRIYDCGVAGIHRLMDQLPKLRRCRAIICIAGMDGALASVVGGLVDKPVIAVPTSVGYGASFKGLASLLTMMNSCAQGVAVVNIDNGFGAACFAVTVT